MRYITLSIIAIILLIVFAMFFGPFGSLVVLIVAAGVIGHLYAKTMQLESRIAELEKLQGIMKDDDYHMSNDDIEKELEQYIEPEDNK